MTTELVQAAQTYIDLGLSVIALTGKTPNGRVHRHGLKEPFYAPMSMETKRGMEAAFEHPLTTGVGILTSFPYVVVDIDGEAGAQAWLDIAGEEEFMPTRWVAKTGRGLHLWYGTILQTNTFKLGEMLDLKGDGGYVAAPPSRHPDGHLYEWLLPPDSGAPMMMPAALESIITRRAQEAEAFAQEHRQFKSGAKRALVDGVLYAVATFDGIIEHMLKAPEGNRNAMLYWAARTMAEEGADPEDMEELFDTAIKAGLERVETRRSIRSALKATRGA